MRYSVEWDGETVTLPPLGKPESRGVSVTCFGDGARRLDTLARSVFCSTPNRTRVTIPVVLIPRPDHEFDDWAVSVALPKSAGGDEKERHLGFLKTDLIERLGEETIPRLAALSDGEINCTAILERDEGNGNYAETDPNRRHYVVCANSTFCLDLPRSLKLSDAIEEFFLANGVDNDDEGRESTASTLDQLVTFNGEVEPLGELTLVVEEGSYIGPRPFQFFVVIDDLGIPSSLVVYSADTPIGCVTLGHLLLRDERHRMPVLDWLRSVGIPAASPQIPRPEHLGADWPVESAPNGRVIWHQGGFDLRTANIGPDETTFAYYNPTTKKLWVNDQPLVAPASVLAARLGFDVVEIGLPPQRWGQLSVRDLRDREYEWMPNKPKVQPLSPNIVDLIPPTLFDNRELERIAQPGWKRVGAEPTESLEKLTPHRATLFPEHSYLDFLDVCRICERPAGQFRTPFCQEALAYCHRCLAMSAKGLPNMQPNLERATARTILAVRALSDCEFDGAAFVEAQLVAVHGDPNFPLMASEIDRRVILRMAIIRSRLPWTRILMEAGLADEGIRLSRGTVLKAVDGHLCMSMQEKAVDDFFHRHNIAHDREPLYPFDKELNPNTRRRADWLLFDGTLVEMWGMPDDAGYAAKMREKVELAEQHGLRLIELTVADIRRLGEIFAPWFNSGGNQT